MVKKLSHVDNDGRPAMVDVSEKRLSQRFAHARGRVRLPANVLAALADSEIQTKKGPVFATAIIAGVMAAKKTHDLIPFCHPLGLEKCDIAIAIDDSDAIIDCRCQVEHKTGVEMEALTGVSVAALTIYDMCKALSHEIVIGETRLIEKTGGRSDFRYDG